jgi:hypothetical protein
MSDNSSLKEFDSNDDSSSHIPRTSTIDDEMNTFSDYEKFFPKIQDLSRIETDEDNDSHLVIAESVTPYNLTASKSGYLDWIKTDDGKWISRTEHNQDSRRKSSSTAPLKPIIKANSYSTARLLQDDLNVIKTGSVVEQKKEILYKISNRTSNFNDNIVRDNTLKVDLNKKFIVNKEEEGNEADEEQIKLDIKTSNLKSDTSTSELNSSNQEAVENIYSSLDDNKSINQSIFSSGLSEQDDGSSFNDSKSTNEDS